MTDSKVSKVLDSSVWLEYFHNKTYKEVIDSNEMLLVSPLSLFEIKRKMLKDEQSAEKIKESLSLIKKRSITIVIDEKIADSAAEISHGKRIPAVDSIIYATALSQKAILITMDNDFRDLESVTILENS